MKTWKKAVLLILPVAALGFCFLPDGVKMVFAPTPETRSVSYYPYWHMLPVGYGQFAPMLTMIAAAVLVVLAAVGLRKNTLAAVKAVSAVAFVLSVLPVAFESYTAVGAGISALLAAEFIFSGVFLFGKKHN